MKTSACTVALVAVALFAFGELHAAGPGRYAVIVGINDYADKAIPDLKYAESDARAVYDTLTDPKVGRFNKTNITLLLGKAATPSAIKAALYKLRGVDRNDLVVVFYSGHGAKEDDEAFWVTQNADRKALPATSLTNSDIRKYLKKIPSQRLVVLLDCCYAASTVKKSLADPKKLFGEFAGKGRVTIAGSADNQEALEYEDKKSGVFTHFLVQGLRGKADSNADGVVTFNEVWTYLGDNVRKASVQQGGLHEPVIITEGGITPQFLLTLNPAVQSAANEAVAALRKLFAADKITGVQFDMGRRALSEPAIEPVARAKRKVFADLAAGRLAPEYLQAALDAAMKKVTRPVTPAGGKPTLAVVPFDTLGRVNVKDAGAILAERLLPMFARRYEIIDQAKLRRFLDQDDLTVAGVSQLVRAPRTKALSKAVKMRGVQYLVVGTITGSPDGSLSVTARLDEWQSGSVSRTGQVRAENWATLERRLAWLAGQLLGDIGVISTGGDGKLPALPEGLDKLTARIQQLEAVEAELKKSRGLYTDKHPTVSKLAAAFASLGKMLAADVEMELKRVQAEDAKLASLYKDAHPHRQALSAQMFLLRRALSGVIARAGAAVKPSALTLTLAPGMTMKLVRIEAGKFTMGSENGSSDEKPVHQVTLTKPFYMGVTEVTQAQFKAVMNAQPWEGQTYAKSGAENAASCINWDEATAFCVALSKKTGRTVRLPTEAEWEYACRAGTTTAYSFGDDASKLGDYAWYSENAYKKDEKYAHTVGAKKPNAWGLYDMHGNVWEWCSDWYADSYANADTRDPKGPASGKARVLRGGSWFGIPGYCRAARRLRFSPDNRNYRSGFRVVVVSGVGVD